MADKSCALPRLVVAGTQSGAGKTTLTAGLIAAFRRRSLTVQPFKVGPDYIDASYHSLAADRICRNLDAWLLPPAAVRASFARGSGGADLAIVEGVMGLFDGYGYDDEAGSTAHVAKLIGAPVVLVLSIRSLARSAAALARGYAEFDPDLRVAGFILNDAAGPSHGAGVARAVADATGLPCFGWLPHADRLSIPERHLGLVPVAEPGRWTEFVEAAADHVEQYLDLHALLAAAQPEHVTAALETGPLVPMHRGDGLCRIAVARDEAFSFYYEDNLELLRDAGAEIAFFSPLQDETLPAGSQGLYIGGGFPEVYAARLAANVALRAELARVIAGGLPTYAECGGLMYLTGSICDTDGHTHPMVGALPGRSIMTGRLTLGYREVVTERATLLAPAGRTLRGHEFHFYEWIERPHDAPAAYRCLEAGALSRWEGYAHENLLASYVHLHWGAAPELAAAFAAACRG